MSYLIDTNIFISSFKEVYPIDIFPSFWREFSRMATEGLIFSLDKVKGEIFRNEDLIKEWCSNNLPTTFFLGSTECLDEYATLSAWVQTKGQYKDYAKQIFLDVNEADAWLVAYSMKNQFCIVTNETSAPDSKKSIKIPEPCDAHGVEYINLVEMFRRLKFEL